MLPARMVRGRKDFAGITELLNCSKSHDHGVFEKPKNDPANVRWQPSNRIHIRRCLRYSNTHGQGPSAQDPSYSARSQLDRALRNLVTRGSTGVTSDC